MPTRTYLTTPPGREPQLDAPGAGVVERWVPGLRLPVEPVPRRRGRLALLVAAVVVAVALAAVAAIDAVTSTQAQDPSLSDRSTGQG